MNRRMKFFMGAMACLLVVFAATATIATISTATNKISYAGDGSTTEFSFPYYYLSTGDVLVVLIDDATSVETTQVEDTDYTITAPSESGGTVTMTTAPAVGETLVLYRSVAMIQSWAPVEGGPLRISAMEQALDRTVMMAQQIYERQQRTVSSSIADGPMELLPAAADRALKAMAFDAAGNPVAVDLGDGYAASEYGGGLMATTSATAARSYLEVTLANLGVVNTASTIDSKVDLLSGITGVKDSGDAVSASDADLATAGYVGANGVPAGAVMAFAMETAPSNWLECDGSAKSRSTYANLFAAIGTTFGPGDGSTTFNLPDMRGQFARGWDHGASIDPDAATRTDAGDGSTTGDHVGTQQADAFESHRHSSVTFGAGTGMMSGVVIGATGTNTGYAGGNETRPKNVYLMYCIKY